MTPNEGGQRSPNCRVVLTLAVGLPDYTPNSCCVLCTVCVLCVCVSLSAVPRVGCHAEVQGSRLGATSHRRRQTAEWDRSDVTYIVRIVV